MQKLSIKRTSRWLPVFLLLLAACTSPKQSIQTKSSPDLVTYGPAWGSLWQQRSAEYKALCFQAYNLARFRLDEYTRLPSNKPFAVITDIDETVLDNSPYQVHQALKGLGYDDSSWMDWTSKVQCDTVPGALSFLKYAASKNVEVFYVTNRLQAERNATISNLNKWNFPYADSAHVLLKTTTSGKDERRAMIASNYNVILFMGDNLGDFSGIYDHKSYEERNTLVNSNASMFGNHFIVLPNAMYGEWLGALINYKYGASKAAQNAELIRWMINY